MCTCSPPASRLPRAPVKKKRRSRIRPQRVNSPARATPTMSPVAPPISGLAGLSFHGRGRPATERILKRFDDVFVNACANNKTGDRRLNVGRQAIVSTPNEASLHARDFARLWQKSYGLAQCDSKLSSSNPPIHVFREYVIFSLLNGSIGPAKVLRIIISRRYMRPNHISPAPIGKQ